MAETDLGARVRSAVWADYEGDVRDIEIALDDDEKSRLYERLLGDLRERLALRPSRSARTSSGNAKMALSPEEQSRSDAVSEFLFRRAEREPSVAAFREQYLSGRVLHNAEAKLFMGSLALASFDARALHRLGVPLIGHRAMPERRGKPPREYLRLTFDGGDVTVSRWNLRRRKEKGPWMDILVDDGMEGLFWGKRPVADGSVLHDLWSLGEGLRFDYPWSPKATYLFVLTNRSPMFAPISASWVHSQMKIERLELTITADVWAKAETVRNAFHALQRRYLGSHNRSLSERNLALFGFVDEMRTKLGDLPSWSQITRDWNKKFPDWADTDYRHVRRDFQRIERLLTAPGLKL